MRFIIILISFVCLVSCKKATTSIPPCVTHSNLTLPLSDSLELINCDSEALRFSIDLENGNWTNPWFDTITETLDTIHVKFNSKGAYILKYIEGQNLGTGQPYEKHIIVN
ncbi:MAG: hypothetical protein P8M05_07975 [Flavobacteriales bacterium]|nr:hypothetical protein [Flavobacteriales bacterium]